MRIKHHELLYTLDDDWLKEAEMVDFVPQTKRYHSDRQDVKEVSILEVAPLLRRAAGVGIFKDNPENGCTARERVVNILRGFRLGHAIPPVEVVENKSGIYRYDLTHGAHRFYCSVAVGFTYVPTVEGFDLSAFK